jgi:hypothetical protein
VVQGAVFQGLVARGTVFQCRRIHDASAMSIMVTLRSIDLSYPFWTWYGTEDSVSPERGNVQWIKLFTNELNPDG